MRNLLFAGVALAALAGIVLPAKADIISFDLTEANSDITSGGGTGPYAKVTVDETSASAATITFDQLGQYYLMAQGAAALNINGAFTVGTITGTAAPSDSKTPSYNSGGAGQEDGFGNFNFSVNENDGWASASSEIVITLTGSGIWTYATDVLAGNNYGFLAAAHIGYDGGSYTGYAGNGSGTYNAPEPASIAVLGAGLIGLGMLRRRMA